MGFFDAIKGLFKSGPKKPAGEKLVIVDIDKRFELIGRTGQGSMSKVWRARDRKIGRTVCLKVLDKEKTAKFEARFLGLKRPSEGAICAGLKHKNVVQTFEYGLTTKKEMFLVMELIEGVGMNFLVETQGKQLQGHRIDYLAQLAEALEYIHRQGFIHRDICPRNVMINTEGLVKLIDFGLTIPSKPEFLRPGNRTGTTDYLAPELIARRTTDARVDLFALGVTAYEVYTGMLPWEKGTSQETLHKHLNMAGRDPHDSKPDLDKPTADFLRKAIERDPALRFQTAGEFREALLRLPKA
ncbi:MAG: serine/threonine-protein kinase [Gemmataceae bacterium]